MTSGVVTNALNGLDNALLGIMGRTVSVADAFRNMTVSILNDIAKMLIRSQISAPIAQALGSLFTIGVGNVATATTYGTNIGSQQTNMLMQQEAGTMMGGRALGGNVMAGNSYLIGEKGAEIFTPNMNGTITPNDALGGVTVNQTFNIQTGVSQTVRTEIQSMMPRIMEATKAAVADSRRRGGSYGKMMS